MTTNDYISRQLPERQALLQALHRIIMDNDSSVKATVGTMMRMEMILYNADTFKYGLAGGGKQHMSLHLLPIYGMPALHEKYKALLPRAAFQKGCINFKTAEDLSLETVAALIRDCAPINLLKIKEEYARSRKK